MLFYEVCGHSGRLQRIAAGDTGNERGDKDILVCDSCFESRTDYVAVCRDWCGLSSDHDGECKPSI